MFQGRRRFSRFRPRFSGSRPVARKQRYWVQTADGATEVAAQVTSLIIMSQANWPGLANLGMQGSVRIRRALLLLTSSTQTTLETRTYGVLSDDASDSGATGWDPSSTATANQRIPQRVHRWGALFVPSTATASQVPAAFEMNLDAVRDLKLNIRQRTDEVLFLNISPAAAAGDQLIWTLRSRVLIEIG